MFSRKQSRNVDFFRTAKITRKIISCNKEQIKHIEEISLVSVKIQTIYVVYIKADCTYRTVYYICYKQEKYTKY